MAEEATKNSNDMTETNDEQNKEISSNETMVNDEVETNVRTDDDIVYSALEVEADAFTRFIERQRMDVMFELRRLRLGDRPVSGQPNRERIETFLHNREERRQVRRTPSTRTPFPSAHQGDIDALVSRGCVTSALGTAAFRRDLENRIRQTISIRPPQAVEPTTQQVSTRIPSQTSVQVLPQAPSQVTSQIAPRAPSPPAPTLPVRQRTETNIPPTAVQRVLNLQERENELNAWEAIGQIQRERIVVEISDLVHRQLVTSALESDFRQHLERNVLFRLERGAPIDEDPRTILRQQGTQPVPLVTSPAVPTNNIPTGTANTTTTTQRGPRMTLADLDALTSRLDSMQQMMQLMFSMQLEMQRTLRQEVASALANSTDVASNLPRQTVDAGLCTVCLSDKADTVLYQCGHLCVCYTCGLQLRQSRTSEGTKCPVCRAPIEDIIRVYRSSQNAE